MFLRACALAERERLDVVYGVRTDRRTDSPFKHGTAGLYCRAIRRVVGATVPRHAGDRAVPVRQTSMTEHRPRDRR
ncbi:hypothetical protein [Actinoplanes sp. NPDC051851]|uniref:hypothetical protein n=1 Tax=Actinoplanes sp. NPDC051851 TaxID=3154753 RepID=UPI003441D691